MSDDEGRTDLSKKLDDELFKSLEYLFRDAADDKAAERHAQQTDVEPSRGSASSLGGPNMFLGVVIGLVLGVATTLTKSADVA